MNHLFKSFPQFLALVGLNPVEAVDLNRCTIFNAGLMCWNQFKTATVQQTVYRLSVSNGCVSQVDLHFMTVQKVEQQHGIMIVKATLAVGCQR
jgi:hypothetical protein